jgi:serine/threonine protein kinase/tetratricopeptide (TPR) repeat protein
MIGSQILHYRVLEKLGEGGMGEVFLAEDTKLDRKVALKFLPYHFSKDPDFKARFEHEAKAAAALNHPNIVTVFELNEYEGRLFIAMEYVEGKSLEQLIAAGDLPLEQTVDIARQICDGLGKAHAAGIIHRDIKPSNILIDTDGRARILDFGLAKSHKATTETKTGTTLGTLQYESPEQCVGKPVDARSDLFSVGCVLYEMIAGRPPFTGEAEEAIRYSILNEEPEPLARYKSGDSQDLQRIVSKLLEKDPELRYQSAAGITADLKRLGTAPAEAQHKGRRWLAPLVVALVLILAAAALFTICPWCEDHEAPVLAVLPFENLGEPEDEQFADAIATEIGARVSKVHGLKVIASLSAGRFKGSTASVGDIGQELGATHLLTGSVRWQRQEGRPDRIRIVPELIKSSDASQVWADVYDGELNEVIALPTDIAAEVIGALDVTLVAPEERALNAKPTQDLEAYQYFVRGREYWHRWEEGVEDLDRAIEFFEKAVSLDTTFADAWAELASVSAWYYASGFDHSEARIEIAEEAAERACQHDSLGGISHLALGYVRYYIRQDYAGALKEFELARKALPNSSDAIASVGYIKRRFGAWSESLKLQRQASALNPFNAWMLDELIWTCIHMRRWTEAQQLLDRAMALYPDRGTPYRLQIEVHLSRDGDLEAMRNTLRTAESRMKDASSLLSSWCTYYYLSGDFEAALTCSQELGARAATVTDTAAHFFRMARMYRGVGQAEVSLAYFDSALVYTQSIRWDDLFPNIAYRPASLGLLYAGLGEREKALEGARDNIEAYPLEKDWIIGANELTDLALTYVWVEEYDLAVDILDSVLSIPSGWSVASVRLHPFWEPLRDRPRFQALLDRGDKVF